jgi:hypothetical protein
MRTAKVPLRLALAALTPAFLASLFVALQLTAVDAHAEALTRAPAEARVSESPACAPVLKVTAPGHAPDQGELREHWLLAGDAAHAAESELSTDSSVAGMPGLSAFRAEVQNAFFQGATPDPWSIMTVQRGLFERHMGAGETHAHDLILSGGVGKVRPATCLEGLFLDRHSSIQRPSPARWYSEFRASVFRSPDGQQLRAQFASSRNGTGAAPSMDAFKDSVQKLLREGWTPLTDVHNHPFTFDLGAIDIGGSLVPSGSHRAGRTQGGDAVAWESLRTRIRLPEARITNGFHTNVVLAPDFLRF